MQGGVEQTRRNVDRGSRGGGDLSEFGNKGLRAHRCHWTGPADVASYGACMYEERCVVRGENANVG